MPPTKSPEDLKTILRTMTAKSGAEKEQKQSHHQQSLKGALADVLARGGQPPTNQHAGQADVQQPTQQRQPAAAEPPREKRPFEVPRDELLKTLKGEI